ncbi:serine/arginine-rich splicing factor SR45a-like isoform X2 [Nicotiana tabacum]|uniref:Serine/arginine-rich splicing factor SR45a-like isoform X2 n=3 Tax=Nicotiana tabacum TaxID=4097 RepID=A0AC58T269_TOBAC
MADSPRKRYSRSPSPWDEKSRSHSRSLSRSRSRSRSWPRPRGRSRSRSQGRAEVSNPGNTLYVTGLSTRVTERDLEEHFSKEGKVKSVFLVVEPRSRISRGIAFITMDSLEDANRCIKNLNQSVLEGRYITVEKKTLPQLCWQQSKMISSSLATLYSLSLINGLLKQLFTCISSAKHSNYSAQQLYNLSKYFQLN